MHQVIFTPTGKRSQAESGDTVYSIAQKAGIDLRSICGGNGLCTQCQVELSPGHHSKYNITCEASSLSDMTEVEQGLIADNEMKPERRLACRAKILADVVIDVPSDSQDAMMSIKKASTKIDTELNPAVKLYLCQLPEPTFDDHVSDAESLITELAKRGIHAQFTHTILPKIQPILGKNARSIIAVVRDDEYVVDVFPPDQRHIYGVAIDVGSTTIAVYMYELTTGEIVYEGSAMNPQIRFGEDLMSRVSYVMLNKGGEVRLTEAVRNQVSEMLHTACAELEVDVNLLLEVVLVGNPIMHHLFLGISPVELGQAPFTLALKDWYSVKANEIGLKLAESARASFFPLIGGHVGADTTAAYLTQLDGMKDKTKLLVDIGTNAEIILSYNGRVAACSSPTGPAFEGAEISAGVRASPGAIERVMIDPITLHTHFKVIGEERWYCDAYDDLTDINITGICGSGIFEVMVELATAGLIDNSGLFVSSRSPRFEQQGNTWRFLLVDKPDKPIYIKQTDVRAIQLAKAALSAGVSLLIDYLQCDAFDEVLLAGAFGTHLSSEYVANIGLIPQSSPENIRSVGNAAGMGAALALLNQQEKQRIIAAVKHVEKLETATEPKFQDYFVEAMKFPTAPEPSKGADDGSRRSRRRRRG